MNNLVATLLIVAAAQLAAIVTLARHPHPTARELRFPTTVHALCFGTALLVSVAFGGSLKWGLLTALSMMALSFLALRRLTAFRPVGSLFVVTCVFLSVLPVVWLVPFAAKAIDSGVSTVTLVFVTISSVLTIVCLPSDLLDEVTGSEVLLRSRWRRAGATARPRRSGFAPMVSVQLPIHAEPPGVVIETLDALSLLDYPDYEVLVIDNNTTDESLWRPVEEHCARLGPRFRFLHVEGITGAKAGALNWARPHIDPRAEVVGVVDADYIVEPDWLTDTVGYFEDPETGFVQCPHAYRDYESSAFTRIANAEYALFFAAHMVALDENGAGLTVGTMSTIRLAALDKAGGWAEWCLTEDSELAIRIHASGYKSVYLKHPYGRGLVPETWNGYRKQRFRWTYGPVQEIRAHAHMFRPGAGRTASHLNVTQRIHHANHGLINALRGVRFAGVAVPPAMLLSMIANDDVWPVPVTWYVPFLFVMAGRRLLQWTVYRKVMGFTAREFAGAVLAQRALFYVIGKAALLAMLNRPAIWNRTDKFRRLQSRIQVFNSAGEETVLAVLFLLFAVLSATALPFGVVSVAMTLTLLYQAVSFSAAPALSYLAEREIRRDRAPARVPGLV
ncbi:glycosyltransferase [Streptomyces sp. ME02-8801-2C]|uniref:glycosyltransferase n=1 Tax=Streptomyces sp. ME02-8801-2C TaxID=3028680 RepID=UPI00299FC526|nr:glycosyltransferase [Streptomyces sp. ME02-8801-2C]MDX3453357.1 glycosyltransferase [Streptomyces sp. ME02-8801-2C]